MSGLRVLVGDDCSDDAVLLLRELCKGGYEAASRVAATRAEVEEALSHDWDIVVDHTLPGFGGMEALGLVREAADVPVILVSGAVGEEAAVAAMKACAARWSCRRARSRGPSRPSRTSPRRAVPTRPAASGG